MMIDVLICEDSFASDICKAKTSALRAALHISPSHARGGISEINQELQHVAEELKKTLYCSLISGCPKKGKFTHKIKKGSILEAECVIRGSNHGNYKTNGEIHLVEIAEI